MSDSMQNHLVAHFTATPCGELRFGGSGEAGLCSARGEQEWRRFAEGAQAEHGTLVNPITGEDVDIMQQCVNLQLDVENAREVGDTDAYREVVAQFSRRLRQGLTAWVHVDGKYRKGLVNRVNVEDHFVVTYDFQYSVIVKEHGRDIEKAIVCKDLARSQIKTRPVLVLGDPAGGKTTFAKQLLIWIIRNDEDGWLVPVMVRVIDLLRNAGSLLDDRRDLVDQFLEKRHADDGLYTFLGKARQQGRLLVILDGFDEAGVIQKRLVAEIQHKLCNELNLVLTSRGMGSTFKQPEFHRFRRMVVKELSEEQQRQVYEKRLGHAESADAFRTQLSLNPALSVMAKNPLLLNVTLSVFQGCKLDGNEGINRGKVYSIALDSMLSNIERTKNTQLSSDDSPGEVRQSICAKALREVLRRVAFLAHTHNSGAGIRDFKRELVQQAIQESQVGAVFTWEHWEEVEELIKSGRLPVLAWFEEDGEDIFRFAHLTFQEFLCAEQCLQECLAEQSFVHAWRDLVCPHAPEEIISREWWQQCIQMFCDLANAADALTAEKKGFSTAIGECFLRLERGQQDEEHSPAELKLHTGVKDPNILTLVSMLQGSELLTSLTLSDGISSDGMTAFQVLSLRSLRSLSLRHNNIGPQGVKALAMFLGAGGPSLEDLDIMDNAICQGTPRKDLSRLPRMPSNPRGYSHFCYGSDLSGLRALMTAALHHPSLRSLELRSNFLTREAGVMITEAVLLNQRLHTVCGIPVSELREGCVTQLEYRNPAVFVGGDTRGSNPFLCTGDAEVLFELLLQFPQPDLAEILLRNQALASDVDGVVPIFEKLGAVASAASGLETLDLTGFWDCGAAAGQALGRALRNHGSLEILRVGLATLNFAEIRSGAAAPDGLLDLSSRNIRDCGAGLLAEILPPSISQLDVRGSGVGAMGFEVLTQCPRLEKINGLPLGAMTERCTELDVSGTRSSGAVSCVIARLHHMCGLRELNFSRSTLTSKSHAHVMIPLYGPVGNICDGGCDQRGIGGNAANLRCTQCDTDFCSTCAMSPCPMVALAQALERLPSLESLSIAECDFHGGRVMSRSRLDEEGYRQLGISLRKLEKLTHLDVSGNYFDGPGFPHLASGIAEIPALSTVKLTLNGVIDFRSWLDDERITAAQEWTPSELLLFAKALARNEQLRVLDLTAVRSTLSLSVAEELAHSLASSSHDMQECSTDTGSTSRQESRRRATLDTLKVADLEMPFARLRSGSISELDLSKEEVTQYENLAPLFELMLLCSRSLLEVDFSNLDFGGYTSGVVKAVTALASRSDPLRRCNGIDLRPAADCVALSTSKDRRVMSLGVFVLATSVVPRAGLASIDLSGCRMSAASLSELLNAMLKACSVTSLDVSNQPLEGAGVKALAEFLGSDKKLCTLAARNIGMPPRMESMEFATALETNTSLVHLDLRENRLHANTAARLRRTMEELRRLIPLQFGVKVCFLLCNRRLPWHLQLPETQVLDRGRLQSSQQPGPIILIFQYCAEARRLLLSEPLPEHARPPMRLAFLANRVAVGRGVAGAG